MTRIESIDDDKKQSILKYYNQKYKVGVIGCFTNLYVLANIQLLLDNIDNIDLWNDLKRFIE